MNGRTREETLLKNAGIQRNGARGADLAEARALAQAATRATLAVYDGTYGKSILLPPTHGVSIELFQK